MAVHSHLQRDFTKRMKKLFFTYPRFSVALLLFLSILAGAQYGGWAAFFVAQVLAVSIFFRPVFGVTPMPTNCFAVTNSLYQQSGLFGPGVFTRAARRRPIIRLQGSTRGAWAKGMGVQVGAMTFERMLPDTLGGVWARVNVSSV